MASVIDLRNGTLKATGSLLLVLKKATGEREILCVDTVGAFVEPPP